MSLLMSKFSMIAHPGFFEEVLLDPYVAEK